MLFRLFSSSYPLAAFCDGGNYDNLHDNMNSAELYHIESRNSFQNEMYLQNLTQITFFCSDRHHALICIIIRASGVKSSPEI